MSEKSSLPLEIHIAPGSSERRAGISVPPMKRYVEEPNCSDEQIVLESRRRRVAKKLTMLMSSMRKVWLDISEPYER